MRSDPTTTTHPVRAPLPAAPEPRQLGDDGDVATLLAPLLEHFFGGPPPVRFEFWDGTCARA